MKLHSPRRQAWGLGHGLGMRWRSVKETELSKGEVGASLPLGGLASWKKVKLHTVGWLWRPKGDNWREIWRRKISAGGAFDLGLPPWAWFSSCRILSVQTEVCLGAILAWPPEVACCHTGNVLMLFIIRELWVFQHKHILPLVLRADGLACDPWSWGFPGVFSRSVMPNSVTPWTAACRAPLFIEILQTENSGVGCHVLPQGIFHNPGIKPRSPVLQADSVLSESPGKRPLPGALLIVPGFNPGYRVAFHSHVSISSNLSGDSQSFLTL